MSGENFADRKADAARLFDSLGPLMRKVEVLEIARGYADENGLPYPENLTTGINEVRTLLHNAGLPQAEIDGLPGLAPLGEQR